MNQAISSPSLQAPKAIHLKDYLPPAFLVQQVDLCFRLDDHHTRVISRLQLQRNPARKEHDLPLVLQGQQLQLIELKLDGRTLSSSDYELTDEQLTLTGVPDSLVLESEVEIDPLSNTALEGLYQSSGNFCTQCEAEGFRRITFYPDRPDVLARFTTRIEADQSRFPVLLSNGNPIERGELPDGHHFVTWEDPFPKPAYLFALVAGQLHPVKDTYTTLSGRQVALEVWVEKENLHKCDHALRSLKAAMQWDEQTYGREYDLDIYMIVAVNDFNMGAMENKGLNIFNSSCVLADHRSETDMAFHRVESVVAHEYFHNWSGNRVTCRDWFQLSLKEGFTVFRDQQFSADQHSPAVERIQQVAMLRTAQFAEDAGPTAHPVRPESYIEINNFYTLTVYEKGAEVVRMLSELVGRDTFRKGSDLYFERFDGQAVTVEDFVACMAEVSGLDLSQFMRWYSQAGTPQLTAESHYNPTARTFTLTLRQHTPATPGQDLKEPLLIPVKLGLVGPSGQDLPMEVNGELWGQERVVHLKEQEQTWTFHNLDAEPVPSLLRGFSAPVRLLLDRSPEQLAFLMTADSDGFNRWDAGQQLALLAIRELINQQQCGAAMMLNPALIQAYRQLLDAQVTDPAILAEMLQLPSEAYIAEQYDQVDVDAIHLARDYARKTLATALYPAFLKLYQQFAKNQAWSAEAAAVAGRRLKNTCLGWLVATESEEALQLAQRQFEQADNMTDQLAALICLAHAEDTTSGDPALKAFALQWAHDPLVMDSWFSAQVTRPHPDALERVKLLMAHPAFSLKNPNKVRALIGAFVNQNRHNFHRRDGSGYALLADTVIELNRINPQIAARLVIPLTRFRRMDDYRKGLMKNELERIRAEKLSPDLFEVIEKSLAQ
ncbi:aminopeptidase N [Marinospirillum alkaliphilum]|uniref:Aminopeptidase N n=1 Tax=Marinospirillum alkaliphilum DSM 21637 TaxID=1122209 RepID=A0A1K1V7E1_9GAMM|nr:aminopeptidase N [Marinospirillum alkaliphilum]SFX20477.1 aminopeptidase N [Marinospirillum alkaliphilum DSM 21637]